MATTPGLKYVAITTLIFPTAGAGAVSYGCGDGALGITAEGAGIGYDGLGYGGLGYGDLGYGGLGYGRLGYGGLGYGRLGGCGCGVY
ncbi:hypothetical protein K1T71_014180 [Dendrolimus kikuchii]|uniref:Uncharacterized protein n=1 Tax=Dendrolimus kikuchii TaxID=765133 RepID=A0ACC1CFA0_9NEOP|nr:hypothetical protein K1T71_014180 [Dendrolimus kikuchii]